MKKSQFARVVVVLGLILTVAAVGCRKKPGYLTPLTGNKPQAVGNVGPSAPLEPGTPLGGENYSETGAAQANLADWANALEDARIFEAYTVYFDFDSSSIKSSEQSKIAAVADQLKAQPGRGVRVEGHCDERGTEEYNRALGERRAIAVREELVRLGVNPANALTMSYGEDRPAVLGSDESAYSKNRRGVFIMLTKQ